MKTPNTICSFCGKNIYKRPTYMKKYKTFFCDRECHHEYLRRNIELIELKCIFCEKKIYRKKRSMRNGMDGPYFCNNICKNIYLARHVRWKDNWENFNPQSRDGRKKLVVKMAGNKCQVCELDEDIRLLDIHHQDEDHHNNEWSNLRCLCVMCHAKHHRCEKNFSIPCLPNDVVKMKNAINSLGKPKRLKKMRMQAKNRKLNQAKQCLHCEKLFIPSQNRIQYCSHQCYSLSTRTPGRPTKEELSEMINSMSWIAIGKKYNVSDNAVRKWAKNYGLTWKKQHYIKVKAPDA